MSSSRERDRSSPATSADDASIGSRQARFTLVQNHRQHWRNGLRLSVEAFIREFPPPIIDDEELLDLIYGEIVLREEDGESPELEEYLRRFPQYVGELQAQFEIHRALQSGHAFTLELSSESFDLNFPGPNSDVCEAGNRPAQALHAPAKTDQPLPARASARRLPLEVTWPTLHGYDIQAVLGSGGMGTVYRALRSRAPPPGRFEGHEPCQCRDDFALQA